MMNGHKCYAENGYLFAIALFDEQEADDETTDRVLKELNLPRQKRYVEARICVNIDHILAAYDAISPNMCIIEMSNGYQHRIKAQFELIEHLISQS